MIASDRLYLWVGVSVTSSPGNSAVKAELDFEGAPGGYYDSRVIVPLPVPPPIISSLSPAVGLAGASIAINGSNFGASQGSSTVTFNGSMAAPTAWSATRITVPVPAAAITGSVIVTVAGVASNGATFTVPPRISSISPTSGSLGTAVTIAGTNFGTARGSSSVAFNGVMAT